MANTAALDFVVFYVSDLDRSLAYFTEVLGFAEVPEESGPGFKFLSGAGGISFGLSQVSEQTPPAGTYDLYIKVGDVQGAREQVVARRAEATPIAERPFGSIFTVHTPDGVPLTLFQPPA